MCKINLCDSIGYADDIKIIFSDKCVEIFPGNEKSLDYTFEEVIHVAKQNGWKDSTILLITESPLNGRIYQFGNHGEFWEEHGSTRGYA